MKKLMQNNVNSNKGPQVHLIDKCQAQPQVFTFDDCEQVAETCVRKGGNVPAPTCVTSEDVLVIHRGGDEDCPPRPLQVTVMVLTKAAFLCLCMAWATYALYWYSLHYSKSSEVLSLLFLLLMTVHVFKPKHFLPTVLFNFLYPHPSAVCRKPQLHPCSQPQRNM